MDWSKGLGYFYPPVGLIARVLRCAEDCRARCILLVPYRPRCSFIVLVERKVCERKLKEKKRILPFLVCLADIQFETFIERQMFDFVVYFIDF